MEAARREGGRAISENTKGGSEGEGARKRADVRKEKGEPDVGERGTAIIEGYKSARCLARAKTKEEP